jgi:hypothetical protein
VPELILAVIRVCFLSRSDMALEFPAFRQQVAVPMRKLPSARLFSMPKSVARSGRGPAKSSETGMFLHLLEKRSDPRRGESHQSSKRVHGENPVVVFSDLRYLIDFITTRHCGSIEIVAEARELAIPVIVAGEFAFGIAL